MGGKISHPVEQVETGDVIVRSCYLGIYNQYLEVVDVDEDRRYAYACGNASDDLFIVNLKANGAIPAGNAVAADCSCTRFMQAGPEKGRQLAAGITP